MQLNLNETPIQLLDDQGKVVIEKALLVEGDGLCAIYDLEEEYFKFVASLRFDIDNMLATEYLNINEVDKDERLCSNCEKPMKEGFYFESDGTHYCGEDCLKKVISWEEYLKIYDNGNGDAYWTNWEDS